MDHTIIDLLKTDLIYIAEGNANIVLKLTEHKKVLRLPKTEEKLDRTNDNQSVEIHKYQTYMVLLLNLLGEKYVYYPEVIQVGVEEQNRLNNFLVAFRPEQRLNKNFTGQFGLLLPDATYLSYELPLQTPTYSIEIKPKQGWMFEGPTTEIFNLKNLKKCRYCCMQYLKLKTGRITSRSEFCPMNLFSGDTTKMKRAIKSLLDEPQNNLRFFKNGKLIYGEMNRDKKEIDQLFNDIGENIFYDLINCCLLDQNDVKSYSQNHADQTLCEYRSKSNLPFSSILQKILNLQLLVKSNLQWMSRQTLFESKSYNTLDSLVLKNGKISLQNLTPQEQYMIGATFLDASIMISFMNTTDFQDSKKIPANMILKSVGGKRFSTKTSMLDLDPKPDNHFKKYLKQTNEAFAITRECIIVVN